MIVVGVHCNVFIVLPIRLKTCRCNVFSFFTRQNVRARKIGRVSEVLRAQVRPIGIECASCLGLTVYSKLIIKILQNVNAVILMFLLLTFRTLSTLAYNAAQNNLKMFNINNFSCLHDSPSLS